MSILDSSSRHSRPRLLVSRAEAEERISEQIRKGQELATRNVRNAVELAAARSDFARWTAFNGELVCQFFDSPALAEEFDQSTIPVQMPVDFTFGDIVRDFLAQIQDRINQLVSLRERLDIIPLDSSKVDSSGRAGNKTQVSSHESRGIFVVHGHDQFVKEAVARLLMRLGMSPILLGEEPNAGRTIIEKLEQSSDVIFAVVLLTGDDLGGIKGSEDNLRPRARQNVVLELGYFIGVLGRNRVCALYQEGVELPSDYLGIGYVSLDSVGLWRFKLAKELGAAGIEVDLSLVNT